jgi:hypothetical protein
MKRLLTIILLTSTLTVFGQTTFSYKDDFKKVLAKTKDANDNLSYDKLLKRFAVNDTTLTDFEVLVLLIGFTDNPEYKPYEDLATEREIYGMNGEGKFKEGLENANRFLKTHPFSVKVLFEKAYSFHKLGQEDSAAFYAYKGQRIFSAMRFSGNGKTKETPTFALGPADGQDYIHKFVGADIGIMGSNKDANGNFLDILEAKFGDGTSVTLYFIIQHATGKMFSGEDMKKMDDALKKMEKEDKKSKKNK